MPSPSDPSTSGMPTPSNPLTNTSKNRFQGFLQKFASGELQKQNTSDDPSQPTDDKPKSTGKRRNYLRLYIQTLWRHWPMVLALGLLAILVSVLEIIQPLFARHIIDQILLKDLSPAQQLRQLNLVGGMFLLVVILTRILGVARAWNQRLLNIRVILQLRRSLFDRLIRLGLDKLSNMKVGGIISRLTDDINKTTGLLQMAVISPGVAVLRLLLATIILFTLNWKLALTALGIEPPIMLLSMIAIRRIRPIYRAIRKDVSIVDGRVGEAFQGIRAVRACLLYTSPSPRDS